MANYTMELRDVIASGVTVFDFTYPKLVGKDYTALEQSFIDRYYFREIGSETVDKFKHYLKSMFMERIAHYNRLWKADMTELKVLQTNKSIGSDSNTAKSVFNDTPDSSMGNSDYATSLTDNTGNGSYENSGYSGKTEVEMMELYIDKLRDLDTQFIDEFDVLFMQIF